MTESTDVEKTLAAAAKDLALVGKRFALVGGLAVSARGEVRFTRDVDLAVTVVDDEDAEALTFALKGRGYIVVASVEHETQKRLATVRLLSEQGVKVDLLFASSGIESEIVDQAEVLTLPGAGEIRVARPEELLAMKVLSMTESRPQDRIDAKNLLLFNPSLDVAVVRQNLELIRIRGFHRHQDLEAKLATVLSER